MSPNRPDANRKDASFATPASASAASPLTDHDALPAGTRFGEFEILRVLGVGGFGIVYLAHDHSLERRVALKEYMPASLAVRGAGPLITIRAESQTETYAMGLRSFINEARLLARFDHPSLVKVYRFWEDNATAYMVMPYLQGTTLRDARRAMTTAPGEAWIRGVLDPMLEALDQLHREGVYHRDIAPDNILIPHEGAPILLDFGAARHVISDRTQSLTAILKPSYAPIEQYADMTNMRQGPWTDVYALGAVMHYLLFGAPPAPATARALLADVDPIAERTVSGVSAHFISVVAWMLGVRPGERPQSVAALRAALAGQMPVPTVAHEPTTMPGFAAMKPASATSVDEEANRIDAAYLPTALMTTDRRAVANSDPPEVTLPLRGSPTAPGEAPAMSAVREANTGMAMAAPRPHRRRWLIAGGIASLAVAALVLWQFIALVAAPRAPIPGFANAVPAAVDAPASAAIAASSAMTGVSAAAIPDAVMPTVANLAIDAEMATSAATGSAAAFTSTSSALAARSRQKTPPVRVAGASAAAIEEPAPRVVRATPVPEAVKPVAMAVSREPATAREACGDRSFFSMAVCLNTECENPRFREGAECGRLLDAKRKREER